MPSQTEELIELNTSINNTTFGELSVAENRVHTGWNFPYNINPSQVRQITANGGTVTHSDNFGVVSTGTDAAGSAQIRTEGHLSYTPGIGAVARFTAVFSTPAENSVQLIGVGDDEDGWFFGYNGLDFGIMRRANSVDTWTYQSSWSEDVRSSLNPQTGNVYEIRFQWLGFGMQYFAIEDVNGNIVDVHHIKYTNQNTATSVDIPSLPISMYAINAGNTTDIAVKSPSAVAMSQGEAFPGGFTIPIGYSALKTVAVGDNYIFTIRAPETYLTKQNKLYLEPALLTFSNETTKTVTFKVLFNTILTTPTFTDIATGVTPAQADTTAAAWTNGIEVATFAIPKDSGRDFDLTSIFDRARIWAGASITIIADALGAGDVVAALTFRSRL